MIRQLKHAFAIEDPSTPLTEKEADLVDRLARAIVKRRLAAPALLFLESVRPMNFIGSQALHFFAPFVKALVEGKDYDTLTRVLERRSGIESLLTRIEAIEAEGARGD